YENPKDPRGVLGIQKVAYRKMINDEIKKITLDHELHKRAPQDADVKTQIVGRYLARALRAGMYWRPLNEGKRSEKGAAEKIAKKKTAKKSGSTSKSRAA